MACGELGAAPGAEGGLAPAVSPRCFLSGKYRGQGCQRQDLRSIVYAVLVCSGCCNRYH